MLRPVRVPTCDRIPGPGALVGINAYGRESVVTSDLQASATLWSNARACCPDRRESLRQNVGSYASPLLPYTAPLCSHRGFSEGATPVPQGALAEREGAHEEYPLPTPHGAARGPLCRLRTQTSWLPAMDAPSTCGASMALGISPYCVAGPGMP